MSVADFLLYVEVGTPLIIRDEQKHYKYYLRGDMGYLDIPRKVLIKEIKKVDICTDYFCPHLLILI